MQASIHTNDFIRSLPRVMHIWDVFYDGQYRGTVRAYNERSAYDHLPKSKFPDRVLVRLENGRIYFPEDNR